MNKVAILSQSPAMLQVTEINYQAMIICLSGYQLVVHTLITFSTTHQLEFWSTSSCRGFSPEKKKRTTAKIPQHNVTL